MERQQLNFLRADFTQSAHETFGGGKQNVDALTEKLQANGFKVTNETRTIGDGYLYSDADISCGEGKTMKDC